MSRLTVVISQSQGKNPTKRALEEELAAALIMEPDVDVSLVPHLYDLSGDHTGTLFLRGLQGPLVVLSWLYPRAARWTLDRQGIRGREGKTLLIGDDEEDITESELEAEGDSEQRGIGSVDAPDRLVYCLDLRTTSDHEAYLEEIRRIKSESSVQTVDLMSWIQGSPRQEQLQRYLEPQKMIEQETKPEPTGRRWYPVIDYDRCTNCMECIDFCLFGVYGIDQLDRILVEEQDNCKKGCPACSRVCPENAILFPGHKTAAIAGADGEVSGLKIDLSTLFGAPTALDTAIEERDRELVADGRNAVGATVGVKPAGTPEVQQELDDLMDDLDDLDL